MRTVSYSLRVSRMSSIDSWRKGTRRYAAFLLTASSYVGGGLFSWHAGEPVCKLVCCSALLDNLGEVAISVDVVDMLKMAERVSPTDVRESRLFVEVVFPMVRGRRYERL